LQESLKAKIEVIELECYKFGLKAFLNGDKTERVILKDATASGYQIQAYLVGCENIEGLKYLNMGTEDIFFDTYLFIVESFKKHKAIIPDNLNKYFNRKTIKKFCMIIPYSAGFEECFKNIETLLKPEEVESARLLFKLFYDFIKKDL